MSELDDLIKSLRAEEPYSQDIIHWKQALKRSHRHDAARWVELIAAMLVGLVIGGALFYKPTSEENVMASATIEHVITKIE